MFTVQEERNPEQIEPSDRIREELGCRIGPGLTMRQQPSKENLTSGINTIRGDVGQFAGKRAMDFLAAAGM